MRLSLAGGIQEHHDQLAAGDLGLHHQALAGFRDVAGLLQADVPARVLHQAVGVVELQGAAADRDLVLGRGGQFAQHRDRCRPHRPAARSCALDWLRLDRPVGST